MGLDEITDQFVAQYNGKSVEVEDPSNLDQCFDLAFAFTDLLKIPRQAIRHLYAYQIFTEPNDLTRQYFDIVINTPTNMPPKGALVIYGTTVGVAGHVCIAYQPITIDSFTSFDQNWDTPHFHTADGHPYARLVQKPNYAPVLGWLIPKLTGGEEMLTPQQATDFYHIVLGRDPENAEVTQNRDAIQFVYSAKTELDQDRAIQSKTVSDLSAQVTDLTQKNATLQAQLNVSEATPPKVEVRNVEVAPTYTTGQLFLMFLKSLGGEK